MGAGRNVAHISSVCLSFRVLANNYGLSARTGLSVAARREVRRSHKRRAEPVKPGEPVRRWHCGLVDIKVIEPNLPAAVSGRVKFDPL
jgi:hypothetical protein